MTHTTAIKKILICLFSALLAGSLFLAAGRVLAEAPSQDDPVADVTDLLNQIDSLQEMQDKRAQYTVSAVYDAADPATVAEHENVRAAYAEYLAGMNVLRAEAQEAYDSLSDEQKNELDPELVAKLTAVPDTVFNPGLMRSLAAFGVSTSKQI